MDAAVLQDKTMALSLVLDKLPAKDRGFAESLLNGYAKYGNLSEKQLYWVDTLTARALGRNVAPEVAPVAVGNYAKVYELFKTAKAKLKYPKIALMDADGNPVVMYISGATSKVPNTLNVTDGGPFGANKWYGRIAEDGTWAPNANLGRLGKVEDVLKEFGENPLEVAAKYGKLTGRCAFCSKKLTDEQSVAAGFGKTCAANYNLTAEYKAAVPLI